MSAFFQVSTLNAVMLGNYDGAVAVRDLLARGSWGIGTYESLDGETIIRDGHAFVGHADGTAVEYGPAATCSTFPSRPARTCSRATAISSSSCRPIRNSPCSTCRKTSRARPPGSKAPRPASRSVSTGTWREWTPARC
jgi:hypothetical protein